MYGKGKKFTHFDIYGQPHSFDGQPASVSENYIRYYKHGVLHNVSGPSVILTTNNLYDGAMLWHVNGEEYTNTQDYCKAVGFSKEETLMAVLFHGEKLPYIL